MLATWSAPEVSLADFVMCLFDILYYIYTCFEVCVLFSARSRFSFCVLFVFFVLRVVLLLLVCCMYTCFGSSAFALLGGPTSKGSLERVEPSPDFDVWISKEAWLWQHESNRREWWFTGLCLVLDRN